MKKILLLNIFALMLLSFQMSAQCTIQVVTTDVTEETCVGSSDASATATAAGSGSISYLWSDGQTTAIATNLTTGTYTVTATDGAGCTGTATAEVLLNAEGVWLMFTSTAVTCNGGSDGTAYVSVMTGVAPYIYIWNDPAGTTNASPVNLAEGQYTVTVTDTNGCSNYGPVTITEPTAIVVISSTTNEICFGDADGTASVSVSGGTPGYTYLWSDGQTTDTINSLTAGDYTVTVTDANGCPSIATLTVDSTNPQIVILGTATPVSCFGGNDGSATVVVNSGNGPFLYLWSNGETTETISNLSAGTYTVTATDGNGCKAATSETITEPTELTSTGLGTDVTVIGGNDGTATVTPSGGTPGYTYLWSDGQAQTTPTAINLTAGTYTVTVTDSNGCTTITIIVINEPASLTITSTPDTCGLNVGTATVTASGGTPGYTYLWSDGQITSIATGLTAGTYTVTVTDAAGLLSSISTTITEEGSTIIATTSHSNETCVGSSDGSLAVSTSGGVGVMTFLWNTGDTTFIVDSLPAGTYTVTVIDEIGCTASSTETIELSPEGIWVDITTTNTCINGSTGTANAVVTTGVSPYTYAWSNGATTDSITGLSAGGYTVSVTDSNGCIGIFTTEITVSNTNVIIVTTISATDPSGTGASDGAIDIEASGGSGSNYTYEWSNGATTQDISGLVAGCYTVTVSDDGSVICETVETICIPACELLLNVTTTNNDCVNNSIGTATATITTSCSSTTYTYIWTTGTGAFVGTTSTITGLLDGTYIVTVTDANGLTVTGSGVITGNGGITSTIVGTNNVCNGDSTGTATVTGIGGSTYTYMWSNNYTTQTITTLTAGTYTVTVTDTNTNCTSVSQVTIVEPPVTTITATTTPPSTTGGNDGSISITVTGGIPDYTYSWSTGDSTLIIMNLPAGCYTVTVTDANGCTTTAEPCIPIEPLPCLLSVSSTAETCNPGNNGTVTATMIGVGCSAIEPITFEWEDANGVNVGNIAMVIGLTEGTYFVTATDANLDTQTASIDVNLIGGILVSISSTNISCNGESDGTATASGSGGVPFANGDYMYSWSNSATTATISSLASGTYTVTVTDATMCTGVQTVVITEEDPIEITEVITPLNCFGGADAMISLSVSGGVSPYTYAWSTSSTNDSITGLIAGTYTIIVTDSVGCEKMEDYLIDQPQAVTITVDPDTSICDSFLVVNATASSGTTITWYDQISPLGSPLGTGSPFAYISIPSGENMLYAIADSSGCQAIDSIQIIQNAVDVSVTPSASACLGDVATLMATNSILSHDIDYVWTPTNQFVIDTDTLAKPTVLTSVTGNFMAYLSATNQFGCELVDSVLVSIQDTTANFIIKQQCIGLEINYTSTSGTEMIWNFGDGSAEVTAISTTHIYMSADDYTVMMILPPGTNNAACLPDTVTQDVTVVDDPIFNTDFILTYDPCVEDSTTVFFSDISTNVFGSIDSTWWTWQGDTISINSEDSLVITQSVMDSLTLYVMSEDGCVDSLSQEIDINVINVMLADTIVVCMGVDTFLNLSGNPSYQYTWSPAPNGDPNEFNPMITATSSTSYLVTITDNSGTNPCSIEKEVYVLVPTPLTDLMITADPDSILCEAGMVTFIASSSLANDYNWYNEYPNEPLVINSPTLGITFVGTMDSIQHYYVEAMDQYGCPTVDSILAGNAEIIALLGSEDVCLNSLVNISAGAVSNGEMLMYEWLDPNGMVVGMLDPLTFVPTVAGLYTLNISNEYECEYTQEFEIDIIDISQSIQATADPDTIILGETVQLDVDHPNNNEVYTYKWSPEGSLLGNNPTEDKSPEAMPDTDTDYQVVVTDENGCTAITNVLVTVLDICDKPYVFFPNVFSPNGDGNNDVLKVESVVVDEVYFVIYNRWGEKVFEGNSVDSAWDGTHNGEPVSSDVYGYYLQARCVNGKVYEEKGNVTVLR
jgi:gliding motility-associated-like protein